MAQRPLSRPTHRHPRRLRDALRHLSQTRNSAAQEILTVRIGVRTGSQDTYHGRPAVAAWAFDLSPFTHLAIVPADPWAETADVVMTAIGVTLVAACAFAFRTRDVGSG